MYQNDNRKDWGNRPSQYPSYQVGGYPTHHTMDETKEFYSAPRPKQPKKKRRNVAGVLLAIVLVAGLAGGGAGWFAARSALSFASTDIPVTQTAATQNETSTLENLQSKQDISVLPAATEENAAANGTITSVVEKSAASVVEIFTESLSQQSLGQGITTGSGSGVIFREDGYIVTNNHVAGDARSIMVRTQDGTEYPAQLVGTDAANDLAVIKIDATGLSAANFADSSAIKVGELAVAIGNPLGRLGGTVTSGIVSAAAREIAIGGENMTLIQTSAAVNPGNSGGGLFDKNGNLIGVVNAKLTGSEIEGLAFAIPTNTVTDVINNIIENGHTTARPQLGIEVVDVLDQQSALAYGLNELGVYVANNYPSLDLQAADRLVGLGGIAVESTAQMSKLLESYSAGDTVDLIFSRNGQQFRTSITLTTQGEAGGQPSANNGQDFVTV